MCADTLKYPSIPTKTLADDLSSTGAYLKLTDIKDWGGNDLITADFGTYIYATLINDSKTKVEFLILTASTIANATGVGITIYKRGLKYYAEGDTTDTDEVTANKLPWTAGETKVLLGTNPPNLYGGFASRINDETIEKIYTFTKGQEPRMDVEPDYLAGSELQFATKEYADSLAIAGSPNASTTAKGIIEIATEAESLAGTDTGTTGALLGVLPAQIAKNIQNSVYSYAADAEASDAYAITIVPAISAYATGQVFVFKANTANTGGATLNVNAKGAKAILKNNDQALEDGDIEAGMFVIVVYDGTQFQMFNSIAQALTTTEITQINGISVNVTSTNLNTLTAGATSDADALHSHDNSLAVGVMPNGAVARSYWNFTIPFIYSTDVPTANFWTGTNVGSLAGFGVSYIDIQGFAAAGAIITSTAIFCDPGGSGRTLQFNDGKAVIVEFGLRFTVVGTNQGGFGLTSGTTALNDYDDQVDDSACFSVSTAGALYAHTGNAGAGHTESTAISGVTLTNLNTFRIEFTPATSAKFYVNGVLKATNTTNLPDGALDIKFGFGMSGNTDDIANVTAPQFAVAK